MSRRRHLKAQKTSVQCVWDKRFNILTHGNKKKLITRGEPVKYYLPIKEIFGIIESSHITVGYDGRHRLNFETSKKYAKITTDIIKIFLSFYETCQKKKNLGKKGLVLKPILQY